MHPTLVYLNTKAKINRTGGETDSNTIIVVDLSTPLQH